MSELNYLEELCELCGGTRDLNPNDLSQGQHATHDCPFIKINRATLAATFDIVTSSMNFSSGFLDDEEQGHLIKVALLLGRDPIEGVQNMHRCKYRAKWAGVEKPIHKFKEDGSDWVSAHRNDGREERFCQECHYREDRLIIGTKRPKVVESPGVCFVHEGRVMQLMSDGSVKPVPTPKK